MVSETVLRGQVWTSCGLLAPGRYGKSRQSSVLVIIGDETKDRRTLDRNSDWFGASGGLLLPTVGERACNSDSGLEGGECRGGG